MNYLALATVQCESGVFSTFRAETLSPHVSPCSCWYHGSNLYSCNLDWHNGYANSSVEAEKCRMIDIFFTCAKSPHAARIWIIKVNRKTQWNWKEANWWPEANAHCLIVNLCTFHAQSLVPVKHFHTPLIRWGWQLRLRPNKKNSSPIIRWARETVKNKTSSRDRWLGMMPAREW